ncbi:type 1 fimbrial protein [Pantoea sp. LS15]|uniref:fimbrial protein n=1 Tax=Enterobacterales TaxID=91347 RepID=UPI000E0FDF9C|nr:MULTISPECIES: fimbrial protein [Enterobacterales]NJQ21808.1 type 1 fimbrial protein [Pantoea sp. LS15]NKF48404.1 type 1 fimbrial protein [Pantoea sp. LS15]RDK12962.1 type 1 fimbrial protein [Enterobacter sp. 9-2]
MQLNKTLLAAMVSLGMVSAAQASSGKIDFEGEVVDSACSVEAGDLLQSINFGALSQSSLNGGGMSAPEDINIILKNCDTTTLKNATITFGGATGHGDTFGVSGVDNVGVLLQHGGTTIKPGESVDRALIPGDNTLSFQAMAMGDADGTLKPVGTGKFSGTADFKIDYN